MSSHLPKVNDTLVHKLVYAPHCYMAFVDVGGDYKPKNKKSLMKWFKHRDAETKKQESALFIGEFGLSSSKKDFDKYLRDIFASADQRHASWTYWSSDPGGHWSPLNADKSPSPILNELVRAYPEAVAGDIISYNYSGDSKKFELVFRSNALIKAPTVIAVPKSLYPNGYHFQVSGTPLFSTEKDTTNNILLIYVKENDAPVKVQIEGD